MAKKKTKIERFLEKEILKIREPPKIPKPRKDKVRKAIWYARQAIQLQIPGKKWEKVGTVRHKRMAKLIKVYWKTVGFKTRIRKTKSKVKPYEVDIKNTITPFERKKLRKVV